MTVNNLRFAIGDSFAVSESGQLFAKDVVITGDIYAGANSNVYTKDEVLSKEQVESTYVSNTAAQQQFLSIEGQVKDMQIIYKSISSTGTIDNYGTNWCTRSDDVNNAWTLTRPTYNASYPKVYYSIQIKTQNDEVKTSAPK